MYWWISTNDSVRIGKFLILDVSILTDKNNIWSSIKCQSSNCKEDLWSIQLFRIIEQINQFILYWIRK
jgi:hypothetical protein